MKKTNVDNWMKRLIRIFTLTLLSSFTSPSHPSHTSHSPPLSPSPLPHLLFHPHLSPQLGLPVYVESINATDLATTIVFVFRISVSLTELFGPKFEEEEEEEEELMRRMGGGEQRALYYMEDDW